jgi:hypothetical protein
VGLPGKSSGKADRATGAYCWGRICGPGVIMIRPAGSAVRAVDGTAYRHMVAFPRRHHTVPAYPPLRETACCWWRGDRGELGRGEWVPREASGLVRWRTGLDHCGVCG